MEASPANVQPIPKSSIAKRRPVLQLYKAAEGYRTFLRAQSWDHEGKENNLLISDEGEKISAKVLEDVETLNSKYTIEPAYFTDLLIYSAKMASVMFGDHLHTIPWGIRHWFLSSLNYDAGWTGYGPTPNFISKPRFMFPKFMRKYFKYDTALSLLKQTRNSMWRVNCINVLGEDPATDWT